MKPKIAAKRASIPLRVDKSVYTVLLRYFWQQKRFPCIQLLREYIFHSTANLAQERSLIKAWIATIFTELVLHVANIPYYCRRRCNVRLEN